MPIYQEDKFLGLSKDRYIGGPNSFADSENVDIRNNVIGFQLSNKSTRVSAGDIDAKVYKLLATYGDVGGVTISQLMLAFQSNGKILKFDSGTNWDLLHTMAASDKTILNAIMYLDKLYWVTKTEISHIDLVDIGNNPWVGGDITESAFTFDISDDIYHPMTIFNNRLLIGDGHQVAIIEPSGLFTSDALTIASDEEIVAITTSGNFARIYTHSKDVFKTGRLYIWDGLKDESNAIKSWEGIPPQHVAESIDGDTDVVLAGSVLGAVSLYKARDYSRLKVDKVREVISDQALFPNSIMNKNDITYFGNVGKVSTFGSIDKDLPETLNNDYMTSNASDDVVTAISEDVTGGLIFVAFQNGSTFGVDRINLNGDYADDGFITTIEIKGNSQGYQKSIKDIRIVFDELNDGEKIEIFLKKDGETALGTAILTAAYSDTDDRNIIFKHDDAPLDDGDAYIFNFTIKLTAGTSQNTTPVLREFIAQYITKPV